MIELFLDGKIELRPGDCRTILASIADNSIDSVVCDPPYHLTSIVQRFGAKDAAPAKVGKTGAYARASSGFMGQVWDGGDIAFRPEVWREVLRVLKPGGHLIAFGGTRTYHRMACAIEDAGFEIRDCMSWNFGSGFPKSHNVGKKLDATKERCTCSQNLRDLQDSLDTNDALSGSPQQDLRPSMRGHEDKPEECWPDSSSAVTALRNVRQDDSSSTFAHTPTHEELLQPVMSVQDVRGAASPVLSQWQGKETAGTGIEGRAQSSMERRRNISAPERQLREREIRSVPTGIGNHGAQGRLPDGTSVSNGEVDWSAADASGVRSPHRSLAAEQSPQQSGTVAQQSKSQKCGAWDHCSRCGKPMVPDGFGTALKPAMELICLARKPLEKGLSVAANVLKHGTGALNIDACRVASDENLNGGAYAKEGGRQESQSLRAGSGMNVAGKTVGKDFVQPPGRWAAHLIHDGSEKLNAAFPDTGQSGVAIQRNGGGQKIGGDGIYGGSNGLMREDSGFADGGSAARFFYAVKADKDDRLGSKHPTVKPLDLMQYLVRLVTPKGGVVLDPFAGTGTTGEAAWREGMRAVLIEREAEYQADIRRRMALVMSSQRERSHESVKAKSESEDHGPLFAQILKR